MSAPDTNIKDQKRKHKPALAGMKVAVAFAALLLVGMVAWLFIQTDGPEGAAGEVEVGPALVETD